MKICKVFVAHYPESLNMGKGMAQAHHAGFQMAMKYGDHPDVIEYSKSVDENGLSADNFGVTITLEAINKQNVVDQIRHVVDLARKFGLIADVITDPSYPIVDGFLAEAVTCGYVLADHDHVFWSFVDHNWALHR